MSLSAAAFCPHPPLLFPEVSHTAPGWLDDLRAACAASVAALLSPRPDVVVVVGAGTPGSATGEHDEHAGGTMRPFGTDVRAGGPDGALPLSLTVGARLLDDAGWTGRRRYLSVDPSTSPDDCASLGATVDRAGEATALLVLGDGSAKRSTEAPGYLDERAEGFDRTVMLGLSRPDPALLGTLDHTLATELWVAGRPAWQVAAGALTASGLPAGTRVRYDGAPRGVGYFVVDWAFDQPRGG